jgi:hypothetical protein
MSPKEFIDQISDVVADDISDGKIFRQDLIDNGLDILVGSDGLKLAPSQFILSNRVDPTDCLASKEPGCDASMPRRR